jgi:hypothetical protein
MPKRVLPGSRAGLRAAADRHDVKLYRLGPVGPAQRPHGCGSSGGRGRATGLTACRTRLPPTPHPAHRPRPPRAGCRTEPRRCGSDVAARTRRLITHRSAGRRPAWRARHMCLSLPPVPLPVAARRPIIPTSWPPFLFAVLLWIVTRGFRRLRSTITAAAPANRTGSHTSPAARGYRTSWAKTPSIRGFLTHDDGRDRGCRHRRRLF